MPLVTQETVRIPLTGTGEWVEIKKRLGIGDKTKIRAAAMVLTAKVRDNKMDDLGGTVDIEATAFVALELGVVAWSFDTPLSAASLRLLEEEDYNLITAEANKLWADRTDDDRKNSSAPTETGSLDGMRSPPSLDGST